MSYLLHKLFLVSTGLEDNLHIQHEKSSAARRATVITFCGLSGCEYDAPWENDMLNVSMV